MLDFGEYSGSHYVVETREGEKILQLLVGYINMIVKTQKSHIQKEPESNSAMEQATKKDIEPPSEEIIPQLVISEPNSSIVTVEDIAITTKVQNVFVIANSANVKYFVQQLLKQFGESIILKGFCSKDSFTIKCDDAQEAMKKLDMSDGFDSLMDKHVIKQKPLIIVDASEDELLSEEVYKAIIDHGHELILASKCGLCKSWELFENLKSRARFEASIMVGWVPVVNLMALEKVDSIISIDVFASDAISTLNSQYLQGGVFSEILSEHIKQELHGENDLVGNEMAKILVRLKEFEIQ